MPDTVKATNENLSLYAGAAWRAVYVWSTRATSSAPWVVVNLTSYSAYMQLRKTPGGPVALDLHSGVGGGIALGGATGEITLDIQFSPPPGDDGGYEYDLILVAPDGRPHRVMQGKIIFEPGITQLA